MSTLEEVLEYMEERFGIRRERFRDFRLYLGSKGRIFLGPKNVPPKVNPVTIGILAFRTGNSIKPTSNLIQIFGDSIDRNAVELSREEAIAYIRGEDLGQKPSDATDGYVVLRYRSMTLGIGMLKEGRIRNMLPKARRQETRLI